RNNNLASRRRGCGRSFMSFRCAGTTMGASAPKAHDEPYPARNAPGRRQSAKMRPIARASRNHSSPLDKINGFAKLFARIITLAPRLLRIAGFDWREMESLQVFALSGRLLPERERPVKMS